MRECIELQNSSFHKLDNHESWDVTEWQEIVSTVDTIFWSVDVPFDLRHMFILGTEVETQVGVTCLKDLELGVSMHCLNVETR
jgi:hypothetical protein